MRQNLNTSAQIEVMPSKTVKFDAIITTATVKNACARYTKMAPTDPKRAKLELALTLALEGAHSLYHRTFDALKIWQKIRRPLNDEPGQPVVWVFHNAVEHELALEAIACLQHDIALLKRTLTPPDTAMARAFVRSR